MVSLLGRYGPPLYGVGMHQRVLVHIGRGSVLRCIPHLAVPPSGGVLVNEFLNK